MNGQRSTSAGQHLVMATFAAVCLSPGCGKDAKLACPTCVKQGLPPSLFCDQDCFKKSWDEHKKLHKPAEKKKAAVGAIDPLSKLPEEFGFNAYTGMPYMGFTGKLRPWQRSSVRTVPDHIPRPDYADHPKGLPLSEIEDKRTNTTIKVWRRLSRTCTIAFINNTHNRTRDRNVCSLNIRQVYSPEEIAGIRKACRIGREVLDLAGAAVKVGVTCDELDRCVNKEPVDSRRRHPHPLLLIVDLW